MRSNRGGISQSTRGAARGAARPHFAMSERVSDDEEERPPPNARVLLAPYPGDPHEWVFFSRRWTAECVARGARSWPAKPVCSDEELARLSEEPEAPEAVTVQRL